MMKGDLELPNYPPEMVMDREQILEYQMKPLLS
jgi:hypothetical protein